MNTVELVMELCANENISIRKLEQELAFANGYFRKLKKGAIPLDRLQKIADYFKLPLSYFTENASSEDAIDISKELNKTLAMLSTDNALYFDGEPMSEETYELLKSAMEIMLTSAKKMSKK